MQKGDKDRLQTQPVDGIPVSIAQLLQIQLELGQALNTAQDPVFVLRLCVEAAIQLMGMDCGGAYLVEGNGT